MNPLARYLPWATVAAASAYLLMAMAPPRDAEGEMRVREFAKLPIVDGGRVKPFDTLARNSLMVVSNRQTYVDEAGKSQPAIKWLLAVMGSRLGESSAEKLKVFRIENDQLLNLLGLENRPGSFRYSIVELQPNFDKLQREAQRAVKLEPAQRDLFDNKVLELMKHLELYLELAELQVPLAVPPADGGEEWTSLRKAVAEMHGSAPMNPAARSLLTMLLLSHDPKGAQKFNDELANYRKSLDERMPRETRLADLEVAFNKFAPFYHCAVLYVIVFLLACGGLLGWSEPLNKAAFALGLLTLVVHTGALVTRMYLQGRPPVTNLYSSAIFIGWGCVILGLLLQYLYRNGIGNVVAAVAGAVTLVIAHNLATSGDTLEMMQAVLDTNFWLATHVTCITLGYTATFVAGLLGIIYVLRRTFNALDQNLARSLGQMIYGVVCFATFLSFTGTVLGGIWADQSWGRFWGWDPKENGALLIVIWNALLLHARWGGMIKQRGMAVLAIGGNVVTAWSWFGTNMLGVGLHSYGFMSGAAFWLVAFVLSQLALIVVGLLPLGSTPAQRALSG